MTEDKQVRHLPAVLAGQTTIVKPSSSEVPIEGIIHILDTANVILRRYQDLLRPETRRRHVGDLQVFCTFLAQDWGIVADHEQLASSLTAWRSIPLDADMARAYLLWMQEDGYRLGSVNTRFSTLQAYTRLLQEADMLDPKKYAQISAIKAIRKDQYRTIDENRVARGLDTQKPDAKKAEWVNLSTEQVNLLLERIGEETVRSRKDTLMVRLSWLYALRVGEMCGLRLGSLDEEGVLTFDRPKVNLYNQRLKISGRTLEVFRKVVRDRLEETSLGLDAPVFASYKPVKKSQPEDLPGEEIATGGDERAAIPQLLSARVRLLAARHLGIEGISMHDGRHRFATVTLSDPKVSIIDVMEAAGWKTTAMPLQYRARYRIANERVSLEE